MRELTVEAITDIIIKDLERVCPLSGSEMWFDHVTGCVDFVGLFRPVEIAFKIKEAMNETIS